nr:amidohydrolase family protein [Micromonospora sp. DSM 115978]
LAVVDRAAELGVPFVCHVNGTYFAEIAAAAATGTAAGGSSYDGPIEPDEFSLMAHHTGVSDADLLETLAARYDSSRFQAAHMGGVHLPWAKDSNITFQTTGAGRKVLQWAVDTLGADRVVFGSDFPFFT